MTELVASVPWAVAISTAARLRVDAWANAVDHVRSGDLYLDDAWPLKDLAEYIDALLIVAVPEEWGA